MYYIYRKSELEEMDKFSQSKFGRLEYEDDYVEQDEAYLKRLKFSPYGYNITDDTYFYKCGTGEFFGVFIIDNLLNEIIHIFVKDLGGFISVARDVVTVIPNIKFKGIFQVICCRLLNHPIDT